MGCDERRIVMPASLNLVGDNKCMVKVIRDSVTGSMGSSGELLIQDSVDGDIGNSAVIDVCQRIVSGDALMNTISVAYAYDDSTDKTNILFTCQNEPNHTGAVHLNYNIIV